MFKRNEQTLSDEPRPPKPLLLWPGILIVILQWLVRFGIPVLVPGDMVVIIGVFGGLLGGLAIFVWWAFFSRASMFERWGAIVLIIAALLTTSQFIHISIATAMQGLMFTVYAIPVMCLALVACAVASRNLSDILRRVTMVATILIASFFWTLLRTDGMTGDAHHNFAWRWAQTSEDRLLAQTEDETLANIEDSQTDAEWPGFRGPNRDGVIHGVQIKTDWSMSPPVEMWRCPIGPGCSSFAVHGDFFYTQEQRGDEEMVSCYKLTTGDPVWRHGDTARFYDSHAGAGPRSTPTLSDTCVYTLGATGILNALDARDGSVIWSRNAATDIDAKLPGWGFASSPLVINDLVIVAIAGAINAYDIATGEPRWFGPDGGGDSYSSPHRMTIDGVEQVLLMSGAGASSFTPSNGVILWEYKWASGGRIVQPARISDRELLLSAGGGMGMRRIIIEQEKEGWTTKTRWTSTGLKPSFNDFSIHKGHAYGFVGSSLACMDIQNGERKWKGGRYAGFLVLLADQDLLVILSEKGEVALVEANPNQFNELAKIQAIEGKTWNHPVLVSDILLVRNAVEMVAFRLALEEI